MQSEYPLLITLGIPLIVNPYVKSLMERIGFPAQVGYIALGFLISTLNRQAALITPTFENTFYILAQLGLVAIILTMTMILFTSAAIVREKERGNMELLITTPLRSIELMIGKIIPYTVIGLIQLTIVLILGYWVFKVPIQGDIGDVFWASLLFICASLTLGLIISTIAQSQLQAMQMTVFILLPSVLLSGFMFPYEGMPELAQWLAEALPATHFMRMIRAIVLREAQLADVGWDAIWLVGFTIVGLFVASKRFKKRLD